MTFPKDPILGFFYYICVMENAIFENHTFYTNGKIVDNRTGKDKKVSKRKDGYLTIQLNGKNYLYHRILATLFIPNPNHKSRVNHKDSNRSNCNLENLEWSTSSENTLHGYLQGNLKGKANCKISKEEAFDIKYNYFHLSHSEVALLFKRTYNLVYDIRKERTWKDL